MANWKLSKKAIKQQIADAKEQTRKADALEPRAVMVYFDESADRVRVELSNGTDFRFPRSAIEELAGASPKEIAQIEISPSGRTLRWKELDVDLSLPGLMMGVFGSKMWMARLGQMGGQATSIAKAVAARLNGMKGGRPARPVARVLNTSPRTSRTVRSVSGSALTGRRKTTRLSKVAGKYAKKK